MALVYFVFVKSAVHIAAPPPKPVLIYDGNCGFCRFWVRRWQRATGDALEYLPFQDPVASSRFPELRTEQLQAAVHLVQADGSVFTGAEAALRALAHNPREHWLLDWYEHSTLFARTAERLYRFASTRRSGLSLLTRIAWGRSVEPCSYELVRWIFLRALGLIYLVAFVSLWIQITGLIGSNGILPAGTTMESARQHVEAAHIGWDRYHRFPTLCWFNDSDFFLKLQCAAGTVLAAVLILGIAPAPCLLVLWVFYLSLSTICREFLGFQWDILLLEAGFLSIFLAQWQLAPRLARGPPASRLAIWLLRWLLFRLMFESGCVKWLSGDPAWRDLSALSFHYETQPLPTWLGWYAHQLPAAVQKTCAAFMFGIELFLPFAIFAPRRIRQVPCLAFIVLQASILLTGNYCFFNLLTIALCLPLLDDQALSGLFPSKWRRIFALKVQGSAEEPRSRLAGSDGPGQNAARFVFHASRITHSASRIILVPLAFILVAIPLLQFASMVRLPIPWPKPLLAFHAWLAPFRSLNSYGLFAVMTTTRPEIIVEGSDNGQDWRAYEFKYKPGDAHRRPRFVEPHQPRLDWQMWFAALSDYRNNPWFVSFCGRLLQGSPEVLSLLRTNPFPRAPPRYIRAVVYDYHFTTWAERRQTGAWWRREVKGTYMPDLSLRETP